MTDPLARLAQIQIGIQDCRRATVPIFPRCRCCLRSCRAATARGSIRASTRKRNWSSDSAATSMSASGRAACIVRSTRATRQEAVRCRSRDLPGDRPARAAADRRLGAAEGEERDAPGLSAEHSQHADARNDARQPTRSSSTIRISSTRDWTGSTSVTRDGRAARREAVSAARRTAPCCDYAGGAPAKPGALKGRTPMKQYDVLPAGCASAAELACAASAARARCQARRPASTRSRACELKGKAPVNPQTLRVLLPKPQETTLSNGLRVALLEDHKLPTFSMQLIVRGGGLADPPTSAGSRWRPRRCCAKARRSAPAARSPSSSRRWARASWPGASPSSGESTVTVTGLSENVDADARRSPPM